VEMLVVIGIIVLVAGMVAWSFSGSVGPRKVRNAAALITAYLDVARRLARALGVELAFVSHPQDTALGQSMRDWIVNEIQPLDRERMLSALG